MWSVTAVEELTDLFLWRLRLVMAALVRNSTDKAAPHGSVLRNVFQDLVSVLRLFRDSFRVSLYCIFQWIMVIHCLLSLDKLAIEEL